MSKARKTAIARKPDELFDRVVRILEQARGNVVRSVIPCSPFDETI